MNGADDDRLLGRYLAGTTERADLFAFEQRLQASAELRRRLLDAAALDLALIDHYREEAGLRRRGVSPRARRRLPLLVAAALLAALLPVAWWALHRYPSPTADPAIVVDGRTGRAPRRGDELVTADRSGVLRLGGYCRVRLDPETRVRLAGGPRDERLELVAGGLRCRVIPGRGTFAVATDLGTVRVTGTEFSVQLGTERSASMQTRTMLVKVIIGAVALVGPWGTTPLAEGAEATRYESTDPPAERSENDTRIVARGTVVGTVEDKGRMWITVRSVSGRSETYHEHWEGRRKVTRGMDRVAAGDRVLLRWIVNDHPRVLAVERIVTDRDAPAADGGDAVEDGDAAAETDGEGRDGDREGEGEGDRDRDGAGDREGEGDRDRDDDREGEGDRNRGDDREGEGDRDRDRAGDRDREGEGDREGDRAGDHAEEREEVPAPPSTHGFYGMITGRVLQKRDDEWLQIRVGVVTRVWDENRAEHPRELAGKTITVGIKADWRQVQEQRVLFQQIRVGEDVLIEILHRDGNVFEMVELTEAQLERVEAVRDETEWGDDDRDRRRRPRRRRPRRNR